MAGGLGNGRMIPSRSELWRMFLRPRIFIQAVLAASILASGWGFAQVESTQEAEYRQALEILRKGVAFFRSLAVQGGYVYYYSLDLEQRWGESRASASTVEVQAPGTPAVGQALLRAYRVTKDSEFLEASMEAARALIKGQNRLGGWTHTIDFSREPENRVSLDDNQTQGALSFLMAIDQEVEDEELSESIHQGLAFMLESQMEHGGWPHQFPRQGNYHDFATFNDAGIKTHMLERALNGIRMFPVPRDVRQLMYKVKKAQGTDIARSFCGLNDHRNLELSVKFAKEAGMISQAALCITHSSLHTVEYYMQVVDKVVEYGCDEICLKDMAGIGRPVTLGKLTAAIKKKYPHILVQYHGHSGPGFSVASMLEVARAGADIVDVAMEPLSWGMVHPDVITIRDLLDDAGFEVPEINMNAYMEARALTQEFIDDFLGYWINPRNKFMSSLLIQSGLPGGMMGSLMADLKGVHDSINFSLKSAGQPEINEDELLVKLFEEVEYVWPRLGYPPLVTPYSQYVKNIALLNLSLIHI